MSGLRRKKSALQSRFVSLTLPVWFRAAIRLCKRRIGAIYLAPAVVAVFVQCLALIVLLVVSLLYFNVVSGYFVLDAPLFVLVVFHALLASMFSQVMGMASWWRWIHFCFPIAIWMVSSLHIPSQFYLAGFVVSLSLFWTTFRTQVPYFPSNLNVWLQVSKLISASQNKSLRMIDIGSGFGGMVMFIAKTCPSVQVEGIEIAPLPWFFSVLRARIRQTSAIFKLGSYEHLNFAHYDVVFAYLSPVAMQGLWLKAHSEMTPGSLLVSYEFDIQGVSPTFVIPTGDHSPVLYVWKIA